MTRRLLIVTLALVLTLAAQAKKETQDFVTQFIAELQTTEGANENDYTCITVSPQMMERVLQMVKEKTLEDEDQIRGALTHVRSLRVFTARENSELYTAECKRLLERQTRHFKQVKTEATEQNENTNLWVREYNKQIVELVLINRVTGDDLLQIVNLTGNFDSEFVDELLKM